MQWLNLWAKTNDYEINQAKRTGRMVPEPQMHPLLYHLIDVGRVAEAWLERDCKLLDRFNSCSSLKVSKSELSTILVCCTALHDLGKASHKFQNKSDFGWSFSKNVFGDKSRVIDKFDHGYETACIWRTMVDNRIPDDIDECWLSLFPFMMVSSGHHGTLYDKSGESMLPYTLVGEGVIRGLLQSMQAVFGIPVQIREKPSADFLLMFAGFVSVCDWIGSNSYFFSYTKPNFDDPFGVAYADSLRKNKVAERALKESGLWTSFKPVSSFGSLFHTNGVPWKPKPGFQESALGVSFGSTAGAELLVVEAPMGLGKTEIALYHAARALSQSGSEGVYFALPTQATSNALFPRVLKFAHTLHEGESVPLILAHGGRKFFEDFQQIVRGTEAFSSPKRALDANYLEVESAEVISPRWLQSSKRALLAPVGIGTIDQALVSVMGVKHSFVRLFGLSGKVVIFDEVHAYDVYMSTLLGKLLARLGALGAKVILLSATLPERLKRSLTSAYSGRTLPAVKAYPVSIHLSAGGIEVLEGAQDEVKGYSVTVEPVVAFPGEEPIQAGVRWVLEAYRQGGCIAWIRNTVSDAQEAATTLRTLGVEVDLLHARYTRVDRNHKEEALLSHYGKPSPDNPNRPRARVVVATQVIEQSVDVDFDAMLTDIAPIDLLLQRSGRLHRHERDGRREGHDTPRLGVVMPDAEGRSRLDYGKSVYVYDPEILARTANVVLEDPTWVLPMACRTLVDAVYERDADWNASTLGVDPEALERVRLKRKEREKAMVLDAEKTFLTELGSIPIMREPRNDSGDDAGHVSYSTRLGASNIAVTLIAEEEGSYRLWASDLALDLGHFPAGDITVALEYQVALSSVSVRDVGFLVHDDDLPTSLHPFLRTWRAEFPWERRIFVLVDLQGEVKSQYIEGTYTLDNGLAYVWKKLRDSR